MIDPRFLSVLAAVLFLPGAPPVPSAGSRAALPLRFEPDPSGGFSARCGNFRLLLRGGEAEFALRRPSADPGPPGLSGNGRRPARAEDGARVRMRFDGGMPAAASEPLPGVSHYLIGNDPSLWRTGVHAYGAVAYRDVRPGVDLVFRGDPRDLEYDLLVAPGGDPGSLDLRFEGASSVEVDAAGDLVLRTPDGELRHRAPVAWQGGTGGEREPVPARWSLREGGRASFALGAFDRTRPLVVDPVVSYATYLGGGSLDTTWRMAVDAGGATVLAGWTKSTDFPVPGALQGSNAGGTDDAFVARISADGTSLEYATYLGGNGFDEVYGLHAAADGSIVLGGTTSSTNFPTASALQSAYGGGTNDSFLARIAPGGASLVFSTYLGGGGFDSLWSMAVDPQGRYHLGGATSSTNLPVVNGFQNYFGGGNWDAFVVLIGAAGDSLLLASYLGGSGDETALALAVDGSGNTFLGGFTTSPNFPVANAIQVATGGGNTDAFFSRVPLAGGALAWSTYFGGGGFDDCTAAAVDASGAPTFVGFTSSSDFPVAGPFQGTNAGGGDDAYVVRLNAAGSAVSYASYIGGTGFDQPYAVAVDGAGAALVGGFTYSTDFPVKRAVQAAYGGGLDDAFLVKVAPGGASTEFSTYFGGSGFDEVYGVSSDGQGGVIAAGITSSADLPLESPLQGSFAGGTSDSFVVHLVLVPPVAPTGLAAQALGIAPVRLTWTDNSTDETNFEIQRRVAPAPFATLALAAPGAAMHDDNFTGPKTTYTYRVRALGPEGVSAWSNEASATTPYNPAAPTGFAATPVSATGIDLSWTDASDNETGFEVSRKAGNGPTTILPTVAAGATGLEDRGLLPDQPYTYRLRAIGAAGTSAYAADATAVTAASISITPTKGMLKDGPKFGKDKASLTATVAFLQGAPDALFDPRADGLSLLLGAEAAPLAISVPPGSESWTEKKGKLTWKSAKGAAPKVVLTFVPATGVLTAKVSNGEFPAAPANPVRVSLRGGNDGGSHRGPWTSKKPGSFKFP